MKGFSNATILEMAETDFALGRAVDVETLLDIAWDGIAHEAENAKLCREVDKLEDVAGEVEDLRSQLKAVTDDTGYSVDDYRDVIRDLVAIAAKVARTKLTDDNRDVIAFARKMVGVAVPVTA